jgi:Regulator of G protein signaling domain
VCFVLCSRTKKDITAQNCRSKPALLFVLGNPDTLASFIAFATSQHCQENVLVWSAIKTFRDASEREPESMLPRAKEIVDRVSDGVVHRLCDAMTMLCFWTIFCSTSDPTVSLK